MSINHTITAPGALRESTLLQRSPLLILSLLAALGSATAYLFTLPALWRMSWLYGLLFALLGTAQIGSAIAVIERPVRRRIRLAMALAATVLVLWGLERFAHILPEPDPWVPMNSAIGFTDFICAGLEAIAIVGMSGVMILPSSHSLIWRILGALVLIPLFVLVGLGIFLGVFASSDGFRGVGFPGNTVPPDNLPAGAMSTVEYCRPDQVPLAMDIYLPPARDASHPAPVALYVHGGGIWGDRKLDGLGAKQANHTGALFTPLQEKLNERGFVVASIDYRLPPGTPWPALLEDAKCAVRFLRAHSAALGIDPNRIGVWGSSAGGQLSALLGLTGTDAGFDRGQYLDQSSAVQAVVDMFGPADLNDTGDASPFAKFVLWNAYGTSPAVLHSASPLNYISSNSPPFLILQGTADPMVRPRQSEKLARGLKEAGAPITLVEVKGAEHDLTTPGQQPSPDELTAIVIDFFVKQLK